MDKELLDALKALLSNTRGYDNKSHTIVLTEILDKISERLAELGLY